MNLLHDRESQFLELRFHYKMFLILPTAQHAPLPSLPFLWPPESCSRGLAKVIAWILLTFACKDDHRDSGNVLSWTELLNLNSALHYPRPSRIRLFMLQNTVRNIIDHTQAPNKSGFASCACCPVLFTLLSCSHCFAHHLKLLRASAKHDHPPKAELKWQQKSPHSGLLPSQSTAQGQEYKHGLIC